MRRDEIKSKKLYSKWKRRRNGRKEERREKREIGARRGKWQVVLIRAFLQELDEHQVRKAALLLISTKAGEVTCCLLGRLVSAVQKSVVTEDAVPDYFSGDNRRDISQSVMLLIDHFTPFFFSFSVFFMASSNLISTDLRRVLRVVLFPLFGVVSRHHVKAGRLVGRNDRSVHQITASICKQVHVFPGTNQVSPGKQKRETPRNSPQKTTENHSRKK